MAPKARRETRAAGRPRRLRRWAGLAAAAGALLGVGSAGAQEDEPIPRVPSGMRVVVTPVQSVAPLASGAWPGGAGTRREALAAVNSEVDFAVSEEPLARTWAPPGEVVEQVGRNPMLDVDPRQLAYRGLLAERDEPRLHAPLHGQVRKLSALLGARLVVVPLRVWYATADSSSGDAEGDDGEVDRATAGDRRVMPDGRAVVRVALVDARAGRVLWKGDVASERAPSESPAVLATLAANLVKALIPS